MGKIYFMLPNLAAGGAERVISIVSRELVANGYSVGILLFNDDNRAYEIDQKVEIITLGNPLSLKEKLLVLYKLHKLFVANPKAIVIPFQLSCLKYVMNARIGARISVIACERNDPYSLNKTEKDIYNVKKLFGKADRCVFQTKQARLFYDNVCDDKCSIIPNPVSKPREYWKRELKKNRIISVCRLSEQKNLKMAIDAIEQLSKKIDASITFDIYGQGELQEELENYIRTKGLENIISLKGRTNNVIYELTSSSVFILSSDYEGISNSMLEALSVGMPVICTDCPIGGAAEMITDGVNGMLVQVGDANELANCVYRVLSDYEFAVKIGNEALRISEKYSAKEISKRWIYLITEVET